MQQNGPFTAGGRGGVWWECTVHFCPWWLWPFTLAFKLIPARDQTRLPCEFGANLFSSFRDIWFTNKKVIDSSKNRTLCSSLCAVTTTIVPVYNKTFIKHCGSGNAEVLMAVQMLWQDWMDRSFSVLCINDCLPSVLWHSWLGIRKSYQPVRCWYGCLSGVRCKWFAWYSWCHPIISCFVKI